MARHLSLVPDLPRDQPTTVDPSPAFRTNEIVAAAVVASATDRHPWTVRVFEDPPDPAAPQLMPQHWVAILMGDAPALPADGIPCALAFRVYWFPGPEILQLTDHGCLSHRHTALDTDVRRLLDAADGQNVSMSDDHNRHLRATYTGMRSTPIRHRALADFAETLRTVDDRLSAL